MKKNTAILSVLFFIIIAGCARINVKSEEAKNWLSSRAGKPLVNIDGSWADVAFLHWGDPVFMQKGNKITGMINWGRQTYNVEGVVNGNRVYMLLVNYGAVYCTAIFDCSSNVMMGKFTQTTLPEEDFEGENVVLRRN